MTLPTIFVVDDDAVVREALALLLETAGFRVSGHVSAEAFLDAWHPDQAGCLVLDMRMPGMGGEALQAELKRRNAPLPIIFMSAFGDVPTTVRAMQGGAVDFLTKPVNGADLIERVRAALAQDQSLRRAETLRQHFQVRLEKLTEREREILTLALAGHSNKAIAQALGISFRTIEVHRSHILLKLDVRSLLELARLAAEAGVPLPLRQTGPDAPLGPGAPA
jgi:FixJ family two-component response regulator